MSPICYYSTLALSLTPLAWTMFHGEPIAGEVFLPFCWTAYAMYDAIKNSNTNCRSDKEE